MTKSILALSFLFFTASYSQAETCKEKIADIQMKFDDALKRQNTKEMLGLEKALKETKANCTDTKLAASHQQKIKQTEVDLKKAVGELEKAKSKNKSAKKIKAKQKKVDEKTKELEELKK